MMTGETKKTAVFDFDHTLINTDVAYGFLRTSIRRSPFRRIAVVLILPLLLPFLAHPKSRIIAMSVIMWYATFPLRGRSPQTVFGNFAPRVSAPAIDGRFYREGIDAIQAHRRLGHRVLVISGSPQELVEAVLNRTLDQPIEVIGSRTAPFLGGLVYRHYCMHAGKLRAARQRNVLNGGWDYGYSDSAHDIPLLSHCRHRFLVNASPRTIGKVKAALDDRVTVLNWTDTSKRIITAKGKQR